jgi:hypothetical protein
MLERTGITRDTEEVTKKCDAFGPEIRADDSQNNWQVLVRKLNHTEDRVYVCMSVLSIPLQAQVCVHC